MINHVYRRIVSDHCVYGKRLLLLYADIIVIVGQNMYKIDRLKKHLSKFFAMKDLGPAQQILKFVFLMTGMLKVMVAARDVNQKMLEKFTMDKAKIVGTLLTVHFKLRFEQCSESEKGK